MFFLRKVWDAGALYAFARGSKGIEYFGVEDGELVEEAVTELGD